jgi:ABC-type uncharacterized transport system substrate-binding protein
LVQREVAVIVASGYAAVRAAQHATPTIPIVRLLGGDPIGSGLIPSLARPGGNLMGLTALSSKRSANRLAWLKEVVPTAAEPAFAAMRQAQADALITFGDVFTVQHRTRIVPLATQSRLPTIYELKA